MHRAFPDDAPAGPSRCRIQPDAIKALAAYDWPGYVCELANVLQRAQILAEGHVITLDDLPDSLVEVGSGDVDGKADPCHLREVERCHVQEVLEQVKGNKVQAAKALGINRRALYRLLETYQLESSGKKNTDAAALAYVDMTLTCVKCHKHVREKRMTPFRD